MRAALARVARVPPPLLAVAAFAALYALAWASGLRFDTRHLDEGWQILPRDVLVDDPLGAVWYLHVQPPLWNLTLGVLLWSSPIPDALTLQLLMLAFAVALVWMAADLVWRTTATAWVAVAVPLLAVLHPDVLANALEPRYELPVATAIVALAWAAVRFVHDRARFATAVAILATAIVLTRALYHPVWLVAVLAVAFAVARACPRRRLAVTGGISLAVVGLVMLKNLIVFGTFTLSSWTGMNLLRSIEPVVPQREVDAAFDAGDVSGVALVGPFQDLASYEPYVETCVPEHDHAAVTVEVRSVRPIPVANFNHECYLPLYELAGADARRLAVDHPGDWVRGRVESIEAFVSRSADLRHGGSPLTRAVARVYEVIDLQVPMTLTVRLLSTDGEPISAPSDVATVATAAVVVVAFAAVWLSRRRNRERLATTPGIAVAIVLVGFTAAWTFTTGVVGELGEQARFRTMVQPAAVVLVAVLVAQLVRSRRRPHAEPSAPDERPLDLGQTER